MANIATFPLPTNGGTKPLIVAGKAGQLDALPGYTAVTTTNPGVDNLTSPTYTSVFTNGGAAPTVTEGNWAYAVFNFQTSSTVADRLELKDTVSITYSFDGIAADDWVPGTFMIATLDPNGKLQSDAISDYYLSGAGITTPTTTAGWYPVSTTNTANSGVIEYRDTTAFDPNTGTGVYGVVLAVQLAKDNVTETNNGEHVKFKVEQSSASGAAFTQSNYTEAKNIVVNDFITATTLTSDNSTFKFTGSGAPVLTLSAAATGVAGNKDVFDFGGTADAKSSWGLDTTSFVNIKAFGTDDVLKINFSGTTAPGLSLTNFGDLSTQGITNEAFLLTGLRALNGASVNAGGIYMMQVQDAADSVSGGSNDLLAAATTFSTYILVDTNRNGLADTASTTGDLLIRLEAVGVNTLQSTNFQLVV